MDKQKTQLEPWKPDHYVLVGEPLEISRPAYGANTTPYWVHATTDIINNMIKSAK